MSELIEVPFSNNPAEQAILLLAAADDLGVGQAVVQTSTGKFLVPQEVFDKAFKPKKTAAKKSSAKKK